MYRKSGSDPGLVLKKSLIQGAYPSSNFGNISPNEQKKSVIPGVDEITQLTQSPSFSSEVKKTAIVDPVEGIDAVQSDASHLNTTSITNAEGNYTKPIAITCIYDPYFLFLQLFCVFCFFDFCQKYKIAIP